MKILVFAASLRKQSFNKKLARNVEKLLKSKSGVQAQLVEMNDYEMPIMNEDLEDNGLPVNVVKFFELVKSVDAVVISTPEYNGSIPPLLKNVIDWLSRPNPHAWIGKPVLLMSASPGEGGGNRGTLHSRQPLDKLSAFVWPEHLNLGKAHEAFDDKGDLKDPKMAARLTGLLDKFVEYHSK